MTLTRKDKDVLLEIVKYHIKKFKKDKKVLHPWYAAIAGMHGKYLKELQDIKKKLTPAKKK